MTEALINVDEAIARILTAFSRLPAERVPLADAYGRVVAEDVVAEISLPPFPNSSMDGYAVRAEDTAGASPDQPVTLRVVGDIPAGRAPDFALHAGQAARVMTGAPLPEGADAVVPVEATDAAWRSAAGAALASTVAVHKSVRAGDYVRPIGEDIAAGSLVIAQGTAIRPAEMGVLAALGQAQVSVVRRPRVAIISTGDELVEPDEPLTPGKIRNSNAYSLAGLVTQYGGEALRLPTARDTLDDVRRCFNAALAAQPDIILSSAGVSVGAFDYVRAVLDEMGAVSFWRVNLRPGKPLAYGHVKGVPFFGLPGNPVSAMVTFDVFVRPALLKLTGQPDVIPTVTAVIGELVRSDGRRSYIRVKLRREQDRLVAVVTGTQSSGALTSMMLADGLLILPEGVETAQPGDQYPVRLLRSVF